MDAQRFLAEFGHIANAPGGIARLRELIIYLAVFGKLQVEKSLDSDVPALSLLKETEIERQKLILTGNARRTLELPALSDDIARKYPNHWIPTCLGAVIHLISGQHLSPHEQNTTQDGIAYFTGASDFGNINPIVTRWTRVRRSVSKRGDILIAVKGTIGKINILHLEEAALGRQLMAVRPLAVNPEFVALVLRLNEEHFLSQSVGIAIPGISREDILNLPIGIPPLNEQSRIVAKVDELMALCDKLETQQQQRRTLQNRLRQAALQALAAASSPHELQSAWTRLEENFSRLFQVPEDVKDLRNMLLDLAVHGLLVEQQTADEPAQKWLDRIAEKKNALLKAKLISKQTAMWAIDEAEQPFSLPHGWVFAHLGEITNKIGSGSTPRGGREVYVKEGIRFLRSQNIWNDGLKLDDVVFITQTEHKRMVNTAVESNDILLNITGASLGRCALVPAEFGEANVSQHVTIIRPTDPESRYYLHLCMLSPYIQAMIWGRQVGMAREGLSKKVLEQFEIPIPPIAEQKRIVQRVAELMRICDQFEKQLSHAVTLSEKLAKASIAAFTGVYSDEEAKPMKAPQTQLIAPLRLGTPPNVKEPAPLASILAHHHGEMQAKDLWQRFGGEINAFYAQLKTEVSRGWILEPQPAEMLEKDKA